MQKMDLIKEAIKLQEKNISNLKKSLEVTRGEAADAPGANVSHSDTSKFQQSNLALGIQKRIDEAERVLLLMRSLPETKFDTVLVGSFFTIENQSDKETTYYLFTSDGGGETFVVDGKEITTISVGAPLSQVMIGQKVGHKVNFRGCNLKITDIQ